MGVVCSLVTCLVVTSLSLTSCCVQSSEGRSLVGVMCSLVTCLVVTSLSLTLTSCCVQSSEGRSLVGVMCSLVTCLVVTSLSLTLTSRLSPRQRTADLLSLSDSLWISLSTLLLRSCSFRITVSLRVSKLNLLYSVCRVSLCMLDRRGGCWRENVTVYSKN